MDRIKPFGVEPEDFERIRAAALRAWEKYGDDDEITCVRIRANGMWNDHIAIQAGVETYREFLPEPDPVTTRAVSEIEAEWAGDTPEHETTAVMVEVSVLKKLIAAYRRGGVDDAG